jgi:ABC-2 type transport system permease protein
MTTAAMTINKASLPASVAVIAKRTWLKFIRTPQLVVVGTVQGAMFLLIFRYVFGGAISPGRGINYVNFLAPGFITTGIIFGGMASAAGIAEDRELGFFDRLRSLPIPRSSVLAGRAVADTATHAWGLTIMSVIAFVTGFRLHNGVGNGILAFVLLLLFSFVLEWLFITVGLYAGNAQAAQGLSLLLVPWVFVSSAFVPAASMPAGLRTIAEYQPMTYMIEAVRTLTQGASVERLLHHTSSYYVTWSLVWSLVIVAVFAPISIARYRKG